MKRSMTLATLIALAGCASQGPALRTTTTVAVQPTTGTAPGTTVVTAATPGSGWLQGGPVQSQVLVGSDGNTYVGLWLDTPTVQGATQRAPLDVSLVIDTSGSMGGAKIASARMAAASFVESLADGDIVSIYAFSDRVREVSPPTTMGPGARATLIARVQSLQASGGTNMWDGLRVGETQVSQAPPSHPVRRVVVISDGQANIGPSSPEELGTVAANGTEYGIQVTAIGIGLDYDERTLGALAVRSAGRLYHLEDPSQMATILHNELELLGATVAANAYIELQPAAGVVLQGTESVRVDAHGETLRIPLGSLYAGQHREILLRARIDTGNPGARSLGTARLVYQDPRDGNAPRSTELSLGYTATRDATSSARSVNEHVQAMVTGYEASRAQLHAAELLNRGEAAQAASELERAEARVRAAAQMHFADESVQGNLLRQAEQLHRGRAAASGAAAAPPAARGTMSRGAALQNSSDAYHSMGY